MTLFGVADHPLLDELRRLDLNTTSPLNALQLLQQWQERLAQEPA
jgi:DNA mismatch repair protein MutS